MTHVATCPKCEFEFAPTDKGADGEFAKCPACGTSFALDDEYLPPRDELELRELHSQRTVEEKLDASQLHIDQWLLSKSKTTDIENDRSNAKRKALADTSEPADAANEYRATVELPSAASAESDIDLQLTGDTDDRPTWDDAEHMERLLAEIEAEPGDEYSPARKEDPPSDEENVHVLDDEVGETVEFSSSDYGRLDLERLELRTADAENESVSESLAEEIAVTPNHRPRRRRSVVRTLIGAALAAPIGLIGGYLVLLWISGPAGDFLNLAQHFPNAVLPASMRPAPTATNSPSSLLDQIESHEPAKFAEVPANTLPDPGAIASTPSTSPELPPAERQTSFESPAAVTAGLPAAADNRYATPLGDPTTVISGTVAPATSETAMFDPPVGATPIIPKVAGAPNYSPGQLATVLVAAREAQPGLVDGDLNDPMVQRTKGLSYSKLAELADIHTFVEGPSVVSAMSAPPSEAEALFITILVDSRIRGEIARITPVWIGSAHRRHGGIFFAGTIVGRTDQGGLVECRVDLGSGAPVIVVAPASIVDRLASAGPIAVVGSLIDKPSERIEGYHGSAQQVVWAKSILPLDR